ncbi:MAG: 16S rRNA (cytosine(1402)-N(4))-methyltransferase RsmH [Candidatus Moranbacteria bacterium]|nr:16S rRNA (cytosine(1402)-N(4))-methyltransferase RsmH [Candidatus Moranbacteria bacterium]
MQAKDHTAVMPKEVIEYLAPGKGAVIVDCTLGRGGHTFCLSKQVGETGRIIAIDYDQKNIRHFEAEKPANTETVYGNFKNIDQILRKLKIKKVDGFLLDLGFSSNQLNSIEGLSFLKDQKLDMRIDPANELSAKEVVNQFSSKDLERILKKYGDESNYRKISGAIREARKEKEIETSKELREIIQNCFPKSKSKINPATKSFMALRIFVNKELENLNMFLEKFDDFLKIGGRIALISFHSGEDRIVKNFFKKKIRKCICSEDEIVCRCDHEPDYRKITKKPIQASEKEVKANIRSRSAKLRVYQKIS